MTLKYSWLTLLSCVSMTLSGCAGMAEGPVPISASTDERTEPIRVAMQDECRRRASARHLPAQAAADALGALPPDGTAEDMRIRRNNLVTAYMEAVDEGYYAFERELLAFSRQNDLGSSLALELLSAIGAASTNPNLTRATSITTGAVTGAQSAFAKSLLNQTIGALQSHMRSTRARRYATALAHLALPYANWNTCQALQDARDYEQAGTLNAALTEMAASATTREQQGDAIRREAIDRAGYSITPLADALRNYFAPPDDALMATRIGKAQTLLAAAHLTVPAGMTPEERLVRVLDGAQPIELTALALAVLANEADPSAKAPIVGALSQGQERIAYVVSPLADALGSYFFPSDATLSATRASTIPVLLADARLSVPDGMTPAERLSRVLDGTQPGELRELAFAVLRAEQDPLAKAPIVRALTQ
jgi:hypothetical protein